MLSALFSLFASRKTESNSRAVSKSEEDNDVRKKVEQRAKVEKERRRAKAIKRSHDGDDEVSDDDDESDDDVQQTTTNKRKKLDVESDDDTDHVEQEKEDEEKVGKANTQPNSKLQKRDKLNDNEADAQMKTVQQLKEALAVQMKMIEKLMDQHGNRKLKNTNEKPTTAPIPSPSFSLSGDSSAGSSVAGNAGTFADTGNTETTTRSHNVNVNAAQTPQQNTRKKVAMISFHVASMAKYIPALANLLRSKDFQVFACTNNINVGSKFRRAIITAAKQCDYFICLINPKWVKSGECYFETDIALQRANKPNGPLIVPVVVGEDLAFCEDSDLAEAIMASFQAQIVPNLEYWDLEIIKLVDHLVVHRGN